MLSLLPDPYPDELFYSLCARYHERVDYPQKFTSQRELLCRGTGLGLAHVSSPFEALVARLPPSHGLTSEMLLDQHTLFPLYAWFMESDVRARLRDYLCGHEVGVGERWIRGLLGWMPLPLWLQYCPLCVVADRRRLGETYWHRQHQIFGVPLCPTHGVILEATSVPGRRVLPRIELLSAETVIPPQVPAPRYLADVALAEIILDVSRELTWALYQPSARMPQESWQSMYLGLLQTHGFLTTWKTLRLTKLLRAFQTTYPPSLALQLGITLDGPALAQLWSRPLFGSARIRRVPHPLYHVLLIHVLGYRVETPDGATLTSYRPFGVGPWPCLNPSSAHAGQPLIPAYHFQLGCKRPMASFACVCGFIYVRTAPERTAADRHRWAAVQATGQAWETLFCALWQDRTVTLKHLTSRFRMTYASLVPYAMRLGLPVPRGQQRVRHLILPPVQCVLLSTPTLYRQAWLAAQAASPLLHYRAVRKLHPKLYRWLKTHDRRWLTAHLAGTKPRGGKRGPRRSAVAWAERDAEVAALVGTTAARLAAFAGPPQRISMAAIVRLEPSLARQLRFNRARLPKTQAVLNAVCESTVQIALRRLAWVVAEALRDGRPLSRKQVVAAASLQGVRAHAEVQDALAQALVQLRAAGLH